MSPRRVVLFYDGKGHAGAEVHLSLLGRHLDRRRYDPVVVVPRRLWSGFSIELAESLKASKIPVYPTPEDPKPAAKVRGYLRTVAMLRSLGSRLAYVGTSTAIGLRKDILQLRLAGMRVVRLLHLPASRMPGFQVGPWSPRGVRVLDRLVWRDVTVSEADRQELIKDFALPPAKIELCYHGLELDRLVPRRSPAEARLALGLDPTLRAVGLVGRLSEQKGHRFLVEAASAILERAGPVQFVLIGSGPLESEIQALVAARGLSDRFVFAGFQRDVTPWIEALDLAVMPSLYESAGLVLLECMAMERPIVASDLPCFREHVGTLPRYVPVSNSEALANEVVDVLLNPEKSRGLAQQGAKRVRESFDIKRHVSQLMGLFDAALLNR